MSLSIVQNQILCTIVFGDFDKIETAREIIPSSFYKNTILDGSNTTIDSQSPEKNNTSIVFIHI